MNLPRAILEALFQTYEFSPFSLTPTERRCSRENTNKLPEKLICQMRVFSSIFAIDQLSLVSDVSP